MPYWVNLKDLPFVSGVTFDGDTAVGFREALYDKDHPDFNAFAEDVIGYRVTFMSYHQAPHPDAPSPARYYQAMIGASYDGFVSPAVNPLLPPGAALDEEDVYWGAAPLEAFSPNPVDIVAGTVDAFAIDAESDIVTTNVVIEVLMRGGSGGGGAGGVCFWTDYVNVAEDCGAGEDGVWFHMAPSLFQAADPWWKTYTLAPWEEVAADNGNQALESRALWPEHVKHYEATVEVKLLTNIDDVDLILECGALSGDWTHLVYDQWVQVKLEGNDLDAYSQPTRLQIYAESLSFTPFSFSVRNLEQRGFIVDAIEGEDDEGFDPVFDPPPANTWVDLLEHGQLYDTADDEAYYGEGKTTDDYAAFTTGPLPAPERITAVEVEMTVTFAAPLPADAVVIIRYFSPNSGSTDAGIEQAIYYPGTNNVTLAGALELDIPPGDDSVVLILEVTDPTLSPLPEFTVDVSKYRIFYS